MKVARRRGSVARASLLTLLALVLFAGLVAVLARFAKPVPEGSALVLVSLVLALVPAALWLLFFYLQDTLEPEPKAFVFGVFVLGGLLASAVAIPLLRDLFQVQEWLGSSFWANLLGSVLVVGFVQEFLKYAAVRYSVYLLPEFDERMDGILYGTAAGLGFATMLNILYVVESGGVDLGMGVVRIVVTALAQASFSGITGYFLARAKFEEERVWWLPLGLTLAAVLNGLFSVVRGSITRSGSVLSQRTASPWLGLVLAGVVAVVTLGALLYLVRRANERTMAGGEGV
ncbi:MAG TPA: PrsW family glutamic-type intramembrane protease [Anaerolineae bacterium]|nr:PrsW family glutamic-type intramembrane protease [Anaerolineae bacterium]